MLMICCQLWLWCLFISSPALIALLFSTVGIANIMCKGMRAAVCVLFKNAVRGRCLLQAGARPTHEELERRFNAPH